MPLEVTTTANLVKQGDTFDVLASFRDTMATNAVSVVFNYDGSKFEFRRDLGNIDGVSCLTSEEGDGQVKLTLMIPDYNAKDLVNVRFRAKEDADLQNEESCITTVVNYVYRDELTGNKMVISTSASTSFTTSNGIPGDTDGDGIVTLIDLSNIIDMFGVKSSDDLWARAKYFDFNNNSEIDIADIVALQSLSIDGTKGTPLAVYTLFRSKTGCKEFIGYFYQNGIRRYSFKVLLQQLNTKPGSLPEDVVCKECK